MSDYQAFLASKAPRVLATGVEPTTMPAHMFDYQSAVTAFCIRQGRAALFFDTGLGKTVCELEFAHQTAEASNGCALILTPLAVARQIEAEAHRFGYDARVIREQSDVRPGINICNYDRLDKLDAAAFGTVILDESSCLKNSFGKTTRTLIATFSDTPFRMCATATPAPNDHVELGTHAEFLGVMPQSDMLIRWFLNDSSDTGTWRLKGHAHTAFWDWVSSWAVMASSPDDLGFDGSRFVLPPLTIHRHKTIGDVKPMGDGLFAGDVSATAMHQVKRETSEARATLAHELFSRDPGKPWLVWCDTDVEQAHLERLFSDRAVSVRGSMTPEKKETLLDSWMRGDRPAFVTKGSIFGAGMNFQRCADVIFVGRSFSYESWYQAVRRCWRFGQTKPVTVHLIVAEGEDQIGRVIDRKAEGHAAMKEAMIAASRRSLGVTSEVKVRYSPTFVMELPQWLMQKNGEKSTMDFMK